MNMITLTTVALALLSSVAAFAQEGIQEFTNLPLSTRTRAEVKAELAQARTQGLLEASGEAYGSFNARDFASVRSRSAVLAELDVARRAGDLDRHNYSYGSFARNDIVSTRSRAEVRAELAQAQAIARLSQGERSGS